MARRGLGKGLSALLPEDKQISGASENYIEEIDIIKIEPNREQPRKHFDEEKLEALAGSIKEMGVILPIIVIKEQNGMYRIIAGERRWRAAKKAGLKKIPAVVKNYDSKEAAEVALIENLQREDLNPVEEAEGYKSLIDAFSMTQEEISKRVGKSRTAITNSMRLLSLPDSVLKLIIAGKLSSGHARALITLKSDELKLEIANRIIQNGLNVRQVEALVKQLNTEPDEKKKKPEVSQYQIELQHIESELSKKLATKVHIKHGSKRGKIEIEYYGNDDLERILNYLDN